MADYYKVLQVEKNASPEEIKQSYKKLAKIHHPDRGGDKETFQKIQSAYETLSDEKKRQEYDNPMQNMFQGGFPGGFPGGGFPGGFPGGFGGGFPGGGDSPFDFIFRGQQQKKKADTYYPLKITLYDVYFGLKKTLNIKQDIKCNSCNKKCTACNGLGRVKQIINMGIMQVIQEQPCQSCNSYGIVKDNSNCSKCNNKGFNVVSNKVDIEIPRGVENEKQLIYKGLGECPKTENEVVGDLVVIIKIDEGVFFKRNGQDLIYESNITFKESVVGKNILIPHFDKEFTIDTSTLGIINPIKKYVINKKGLPNERGDFGNLHIKFNIEGYKILTDIQRQQLSEIL
jgi:molecular chaperone DnaJ